MIRQYNETNFVTSLRALAAMMVLVIHTGAFSSLGQIGDNITRCGKYGVEIFFVISGFSIAVTFIGAPNYKSFITRRIFRIAPVYLLLITLVFILTRLSVLPTNHWMVLFDSHLDAYNYLMHVSFLSFLDHKIANSILGVEWTIPIEVFWYVALPIFLMKLQTQKRLGIALGLSALAIVATQLLARAFIPSHPGLFAKWFPTSYGPYFLMGVVAYHLRQTKTGWMRRHAVSIVRCCLVVFLAALTIDLPAQGLIFGISVCLVIGLFERDSHPFASRVLEFQPFLFLGTISYSIYLIHFPIANLLRDRLRFENGSTFSLFLLTLFSTLVLSTILYLLVERPTNRWGKRIASNKSLDRISVGTAAPPMRKAG